MALVDNVGIDFSLSYSFRGSIPRRRIAIRRLNKVGITSRSIRLNIQMISMPRQRHHNSVYILDFAPRLSARKRGAIFRLTSIGPVANWKDSFYMGFVSVAINDYSFQEVTDRDKFWRSVTIGYDKWFAGVDKLRVEKRI